MRSIGIVTNGRSHVADFIRQNVESIFKGYAMINNYYIDEFKEDDIIKDDVVLIMINQKTSEVINHILNSNNMIVVNRTLKENEIFKILTIPENTKVLVVNDRKETVMETISLLYQIGINHLQLIPYEEGGTYDDIKVAITPGEPQLVPASMEKVIDTGNRYIDISTFINILNKLGVDEREVNRRLLKYSEEIVSLDSGIKARYKELCMRNEELDAVLNRSKEGVLLLNNDGKVLLYNKAMKEMFNLRSGIENKIIEDIFDESTTAILRRPELKDELVQVNNRYLVVNKGVVEYLGEKTGCYFNVHEVTYIKQLEQNLTQKLTEKGMVARYTFESILTYSSCMVECIELAKRIAGSDLTALIIGESGTGKELISQSIHNASKRAKQPFVAVNCAAVPENLLESELFGYEGGAFTGALKEGKKGLFEQANNGTIFLDEIGDMPLSLQARLLRVLQERQVMRIGSQKVININIRVVAATNKNLYDMIQHGEFREDLYYRLNVLPINTPPLRKRKDDVIPLLEHFLLQQGKELSLSQEVVQVMTSYPWPGNIRELQNVASYISLMCEREVTADKLPYYMLDGGLNFEAELQALEEKYVLLDSLEVLKILEFQQESGGMGRRHIEDALKRKNVMLTEAEIRKILNLLKEQEFVDSHLGRKGTTITVKGKRFLEWVKNRLKDEPI